MSDGDAKARIDRAFGAENRSRLLGVYLADRDVSADNAWKHLYGLLLWIDRTTGLAHCYESDKCQPGRPWYGRSLAFHDWLSGELGVTPADLGDAIDWLFRSATTDLASRTTAESLAKAAAQREPYEGRGFPLPGQDKELEDIITEVLGPSLGGTPHHQTWQQMTERVHTHIGLENKRKNLLGEGFEDTLAALLRRLPATTGWTIANRALLGDIPGFHPQGEVEKQKRVDVAMWDADGAHRIIITCKWSVRSDREEQFGTDFDAYVRFNTAAPFKHVLVTNEFDAARLRAACNRQSSNAYIFSHVVHVNPEGVLATYGPVRRGASMELEGLIESHRLVSLGEWIGTALN